MIENEFKIMLRAEQYEKIHGEFSWEKEICQTNHYYDGGEMELSRLHITCRVREISGEYFLQLKLPAGREFSRVELEKKLNFLPESISREELRELLGDFGETLPTVTKLGTLFTKRSVKRFDGAELDLDKSEYFGKTDYELEIEFTSEEKARELLKKLTEELGIYPASEVCAGKIRRFMEEYQKNKERS